MSGKAVVLLSGGLDSAVALGVAAREHAKTVCALSIDYGQRHRRELEAAAALAKHLEASSHTVVRLDLRAVGGSALTGDIAVPKDRDEARMGADIPVTYVPARNMLFLALAMGFAETVDAGHVYIGVNEVDYSGYPDCRPEFIGAFQRAAALGTRAGVEGRPISIETPLAGLSKGAIVKRAAALGVDLSLTHSCYDPDEQGLACARCDACTLRRKGFEDAGVPDPTKYRFDVRAAIKVRAAGKRVWDGADA
ncbi:7-cyano-7-deazaguanine synthase QueC [Pseudanabaena sp. CCNP1317]|uniref:7-cyano-7-deazaguanine synthase QueC n=1 Tax=Pseudanabaena sp. CCNP1317 TaxID=3110253 RepID=UPI002B214A93|nr:7-cyano-7-deazaguanine synthase QueC [Pseudanabaena sp. CCNP1317]MEA5486621.1 7-cyano-7-deazaguanine synthase QueC [Pseudanabaena sp. CCNP1317]